MNVQTVNMIMSLAAAIGALLLATYSWRRRTVQGARWFLALVSAVSWVMWWYMWEAAAGDDLNTYVTLSKIEYIGLAIIPVPWLGFALQFSGKERLLSPARILALAIIPLITIVLAFTNDWHGLIWETPHFDIVNGMPIFSPIYGAGFWVYVIYSYVVFLITSVILVRRALSTWSLYRAQAAILVIGTALPWIGNLLEIFDDLNPFPYLYINVILLSTCMVCYAFALFRLRLLDIMPMAYDIILNNVPDGIIVVDMQDRILAINPHIKPFIDAPNRDPIGLSLTQALPRYTNYLESLRDVVDYKGEFEIDQRVIEVRISPVDDGMGHRRGRLFILSDVTARARAEKAQRDDRLFAEIMREIGSTLSSTLDSNRVLSLILDSIKPLFSHSHANIMIVDEDGFTTHVGQHQGYSPAAAAHLDGLVFDYRELPLYAQLAHTTEPLIVPDTSQESEWRVFEGLEEVRSFASAPILVDSQLVGFINIDGSKPGTMQPEIANRLQVLAQQAAAAIKNARLYEQTLHQAQELVRRVDSLTITDQVYREIGFSFNVNMLLEIAFDATLRLTMADGGYVALARQDSLEISQCYGSYTLDELAGILKDQSGILAETVNERRVQLFLPPDPIISAMTGAQAQVALPLSARDNDENETFYGVIVLETCKPERFTEDRVQLLGLIADRLAVALQNVRLLDTVRDRAAELEMLYQRVSHLEQVKSDMIRIAAHDLKNPLGVVSAYLQMLIEPSPRPLDPAETYPKMRRSTERMMQIIEDFLSLDRIEKAAERQTMEPFDMCQVVARAVDEFSSRAAMKSQPLSATLPEDDCIVNGDAVQIYEAVTNFIGNAIKYTPENGSIAVSLELDDQQVRFQVRDNGYGIPEAQQENLFQPFFRAKTGETARIEGTGLGLHLTKNIIERQGGSVIFHSVYGQGSTFGFQLPLYQPRAEEQLTQVDDAP